MPGYKLTSDTLFKLVAHTNNSSNSRITTTPTTIVTESLTDNDSIDLASIYTNGTTTSSNLNLSETDLRTLWTLLSHMIRHRLLKHEPCLLPELGAFVIIDHPPTEDDYTVSTKQLSSRRLSSINNLLTKEPFFVLDTTFARRHRLSRIKKPTLSSALSLSLQHSGNSTIIEPNTTLSSFNMQTIDYLSLVEKSGLTGEQLRYSIQQIFSIIDKEIHPHQYCDIEFDGLGYFRVLFGLGIFEFSDAFLNEFRSTLIPPTLTLDQTATS